MCKSKSEGGGRCEYADALANVRHKVRSKLKGMPARQINRSVEAAVEKWKAANPDIVTAHLPKRQQFQIAPKSKPVPDEILNLFTASRTDPITGFSADQRDSHTQKLFEEYQKMESILPIHEDNSLRQYSMYAFKAVNSYLRKKGFKDLDQYSNHSEEDVREIIGDLDSVFKKAPLPNEPRKLFRFFEVPTGVTPGEYIDRYLQTGEGFQEKGFMSTTTDPEFVMAALHHENKGSKNRRYIVMEIISKQGISLQTKPTTRAGNIQSLEKEVLLPRNVKFRIAGIRKSQRFEFQDNRRDLNNHYHYDSRDDRSYESFGHFKKGDRMNFPLIQMVDEKLIK